MTEPMTERTESRREHIFGRILMEIALPAIGFGVSVGFATRNYPASFITGLAISSSIYVLYRLDQAFLHPHLEKLSRDWVHLGLEMTFSLLEHVVGALSALFVCSRIFGFDVEVTTAWITLGGMVVVFPIIHGTDIALRYFRQLKEKERQEEQLRVLATEAELKALKAQINPHFLFNTLNTIAALTHTDSAQAEATVERLAEMFRYVLAGSERGLAPLEEELAFVDGYLEIERARFGERLRVTREVAPEALSVPVPSLILQPLVENAIRHGRGDDGSVDLTIRVWPHDDEVVIAIADLGPGTDPRHKVGEGQGVGLRNVDERLRKTYAEEYGLEIAANEPRGTVVTIRIPIEKQKA
jgi:signal transduction histidine kinase